jgi:hypothetical protein
MLKPLSAIAAVLLATALVTPTVSQAQDVPSASVSYADLNLANAKGRGDAPEPDQVGGGRPLRSRRQHSRAGAFAVRPHLPAKRDCQCAAGL